MRFVSWNVNGLRAAVKKGFEESVAALDADIIALQETKLQEGQDRISRCRGISNFGATPSERDIRVRRYSAGKNPFGPSMGSVILRLTTKAAS